MRGFLRKPKLKKVLGGAFNSDRLNFYKCLTQFNDVTGWLIWKKNVLADEDFPLGTNIDTSEYRIFSHASNWL